MIIPIITKIMIIILHGKGIRGLLYHLPPTSCHWWPPCLSRIPFWLLESQEGDSLGQMLVRYLCHLPSDLPPLLIPPCSCACCSEAGDAPTCLVSSTLVTPISNFPDLRETQEHLPAHLFHSSPQNTWPQTPSVTFHRSGSPDSNKNLEMKAKSDGIQLWIR